MATPTPSWQQEFSQPYRKRKNLTCHSGHFHRTNTPAAGFVLVRLNASSEMELLLDLRSGAVTAPNTFGFIGGFANTIGEDPLDTAYREAQEEYHIGPDEIKPLGKVFKHDHGGYKYLQYTYVFAKYNPKDGKAPISQSFESQRSEWFTLDALPSNLMVSIQEDLEMLKHILYTDVLPMLLEAKNMEASTESILSETDADGDSPMADAPSPQLPKINGDTNMASAGEVKYPNIFSNFSLVGFGTAPSGQAPNANNNNNTSMSTGEVKYPKLPALFKNPINNAGASTAPSGMGLNSNGNTSMSNAGGAMSSSGQVKYPKLPIQDFFSQQTSVSKMDKSKASPKGQKAAEKKTEEVVQIKTEEVAQINIEAVPQIKTEEMAQINIEAVPQIKTEEMAQIKTEEVAQKKTEAVAKKPFFSSYFKSQTASKTDTPPATSQQKDQGKTTEQAAQSKFSKFIPYFGFGAAKSAAKPAAKPAVKPTSEASKPSSVPAASQPVPVPSSLNTTPALFVPPPSGAPAGSTPGFPQAAVFLSSKEASNVRVPSLVLTPEHRRGPGGAPMQGLAPPTPASFVVPMAPSSQGSMLKPFVPVQPYMPPPMNDKGPEYATQPGWNPKFNPQFVTGGMGYFDPSDNAPTVFI
ncbi:hypothetical protein F5Y12DRAFT_478497 [Xylaria sp. FL1777]|nr:hypothetical protein F5Y12DRAFT_478497 [Xylaria sp. FL1777]